MIFFSLPIIHIFAYLTSLDAWGVHFKIGVGAISCNSTCQVLEGYILNEVVARSKGATHLTCPEKDTVSI